MPIIGNNRLTIAALSFGISCTPAMAEWPGDPPWQPGDFVEWNPEDWGILLPATLEVPSEYDTIQEAVDAAEDGDTVLIAEGTYYENVTIADKAISIKGDGLVELWWADDTAIIEVNSTPDDQWVNLEGLTFHSIVTINLPEELGGASFEYWGSETRGVTAVGAAVQVTDCEFDGMGIAYTEGDDEYGAAVAAVFASLRLDHCNFKDCRATSGGALYAGIVNLEMNYCTFENCQSDSSGGAAKIEYTSDVATCDITSCSFLSNSAYSEGGAIALNQASPSIDRCYFQANTAAWGGAVYSIGSASAPSDPDVTDCQFKYDSAGELGDLWFASSDSDPWMVGCVGCGDTDLIQGFMVVAELNSMSESCTMCPGDLDGDGDLDVADLLEILAHWGTADPIADVNLSGDVDANDLGWFLMIFGECDVEPV